MLRSRDIPALSRLKTAAEERVAATPSLVPLLLAGASGLAIGGGLGAHAVAEHDRATLSRARNTSFGAGLAAGLASPRIINRLDARLNPTSHGSLVDHEAAQ